MGLFDKLKQGLQKTSQQLKDRLDRLDEMVGLGGTPDARTREIDVDTAENLEEILLMADVGVAATQRGHHILAQQLLHEIGADEAGPADDEKAGA